MRRPGEYLGAWLGSLAAAVAGLGRRPRIRMLLISDGREYTSEQQFAPIRRHRARLRRDLGLVIRWSSLESALGRPACDLSRYDIVGLKLSFRTPADEVAAIAARLRAGLAGSSTRFVYFDGDDDLGILWPTMLEQCDLYVKKQVFRDPRAYAARHIGKSNLTDHVAHATGRSFAGDIIPMSGCHDPVQLARLHPGWNIALDDRIAGLRPSSPAALRMADICARAVAAPDDWIHGLRAPMVAALEKMASDRAVLVPHARISQADYYREMRSSRICVSPFGYGELCWRDFEAILCGCLLVKPDMGHLRTAPDLFVPGESYVPVAWDYSDLELVCAAYLADDAARIRIASRAQAMLLESLTPGWFCDRMRDLLRAAGA